MGWALSDYRLLARYFAPGWEGTYATARRSLPGRVYLVQPLTYEDGSIGLTNVGGPFLGNFPAGLEVEPDHG